MRETVLGVEQLTPVQNRIVQELYDALERLGADSSLLAAVGSWGDTLPEEEVLELLRAHNRSAPDREG